MSYYTVGETAKITGKFFDPDSKAGLTPATLTLRIQPPKPASEIDVAGIMSFANPSSGVYTYNQTVNISGVWKYRWEADGSFATACEGALLVLVSPFAAD